MSRRSLPRKGVHRNSLSPRDFALTLLLLLLTMPIMLINAQPISFGEFKESFKLVYEMSGVFNGNKTYEFISMERVEGKTCIQVRVVVDLRTQLGSLSFNISYTSKFWYDEAGRPIKERIEVPKENSSLRGVEISYWWGERDFPDRVTMLFLLKGNVTKFYELDMVEGRGSLKSEGKVEEFYFTYDNLSEIIPFVPEALVTPHIDLSSLRFIEGFEKTFGEGSRKVKLKVIGSDYVETPAGTFDCYKLLLEGVDEYGVPYNSTIYVTKSSPRFTVMYETYSIGVKQYGWLVECQVQRKPEVAHFLLFSLVIAVPIVALLVKRRFR
ncbi:MAG: hypothetical protein DRO05_02860 [Thermoproteota archaeon]|nr:MAG: hypothetical protein DRO05_02860 [Candidatus Korarchaeota archaeon]